MITLRQADVKKMIIFFLHPQLRYKGEKHELISHLEQRLLHAAKRFLFSPLKIFI